MSVPGRSVAEFFARFPDERACLDHIMERQIAAGLTCNRCGSNGGRKYIKKRKKYYNCRQVHYSPLAKTIFARSNLSLMAWFYALLIIGNSKRGVKANFLRKQLGIGMKAAHRLGLGLRAHIAHYERPVMLGGEGRKVYVDEALLCYVRSEDYGKEKNVIIMGIACEGAVLCGVIENRKSKTLIGCVERFVVPGSIIVTDGLPQYRQLEHRGWKHIVVNHSRAFHDFEGNNTNQIEVFWSILKRNLRLYRQVARHHLWCYLAETEYAYNRRNANTPMFDELIERFPEVTPQSLAEVKRRFEWSIVDQVADSTGVEPSGPIKATAPD